METVEENIRIGPEPYVEFPSVEEVRRAINRLKNGKAPGEDQLSPEPVSYTHLDDVYKVGDFQTTNTTSLPFSVIQMSWL